MGELVSFETTASAKGFFAHFTFMVLLSRVDALVCDEITGMNEGLLAHITLVGLSTGVGELVLVEMPTLAEGFTTDSTDMILLSCVDGQVRDKVTPL